MSTNEGKGRNANDAKPGMADTFSESSKRVCGMHGNEIAELL